jgi:hypothetical protein
MKIYHLATLTHLSIDGKAEAADRLAFAEGLHEASFAVENPSRQTLKQLEHLSLQLHSTQLYIVETKTF